MGKRGPKPKPSALNILDGNPSRREINTREPECFLAPDKPDSVSADLFASAEWDRIIAAMPASVYSALDSAALSTYALAWSMLIRSQKEIDDNGLMIEEPIIDKEGNVVGYRRSINPATRTWKAATETLLKTTDRLGLSPGVRTRLQVPTKDVTPKSKFAGLLSN
jgi:P27 family predicted phage terminase small subunit